MKRGLDIILLVSYWNVNGINVNKYDFYAVLDFQKRNVEMLALYWNVVSVFFGVDLI